MKKYSLFLLCFLLINTYLFSQEDVLRPNWTEFKKSETATQGSSPWAFGFEIGLNYNMYSADMTWTPQLPSPLLSVFESGTGISPYIGFFIDYTINETYGIHTKLQYNTISIGNDKNGLADCEDLNLQTFRKMNVNAEYETDFNYIVIEPLLRINFNESWFALVGPSLQLGVGNLNTTYTQRILDENCFYTNDLGEQTKSLEISTTEDFNTNRLGLNLGLGFIHRLSDKVSISPQLHFHFMPGRTFKSEFDVEDDTQFFTEGRSFVDLTNRNMNSLRFSVSIWFDNF